MTNILFLSHNPHESHLAFASSIGARVKIHPFDPYIKLAKKYSLLGYLYPVISFVYSFFLKVNEDIIFVDAGSSLYIAASIKMRKPNVKIIYLDDDCAFYNASLRSNKIIQTIAKNLFYKKIDCVISASDHTKRCIEKFIDRPIYICHPFPKNVTRINIPRKNYGLYVGRLDKDKNIRAVIAFALQCPYFEKFIIVGSGSEENYIKNIAKDSPKIQYVGQTKDVSKYFSECKFLIHLPYFDPHPCTTMESALCGCFPIISEGCGTNYLFDQMFIIKDQKNFEEINSKIKYILNNEYRASELLTESTKLIIKKDDSVRLFKKTFAKILESID